MKRSVWILLLVFMILSVSLAQDGRPMTLVDMLEVPRLSEPQLSPDGEQLLYTLARADWKANKRISHIWRINIDGKESVRMTNGSDGEKSPRWSPDGKRIAFLAEREDSEETQIYLISNEAGEARQLTKHETSVSSITWSPDGEFIYFLAKDPKTKEEKEKDEAKDDVYAFDEDYKHRHLWRICVGEESEERITEGDYSILSYRLSRDGEKIVCQRGPTPLYGDNYKGELWVMDANGQNAVRLTFNSNSEKGAELSPDNSKVLFISWCNEKSEPYYNDNLFVLSANGGKSKLLLPRMPYDVQRARWSANGKAIYFTANMGVRVELFALDVATGKVRQLTDGRHTLSSWSFEPGVNGHIFSMDEPDNAGDVWMLDAGADAKPRRITHVFDYLADEFQLPRQEAMRWKGADGVTVEGLLYYPLAYEQGKAYPLVVQTHGGPRSSDKYGLGRWRSYIPVLTAKGYAVLLPNYRGSTGYGDDFVRDMVPGYFNQSHLDVMAGVDYLIKRGIADVERMVKMGWSAGGHMTNKIITYTDRFKAASSGAGAVNWISMYGQSDTRTYRTPWFGGTPWEKDAPIDMYWEHSPLKDIWKVKTPTIILVGEKDRRVPPPQSVELYRALKSNGVPTHLYIAPRESHGWDELRHQLFKMNIELDWFEKYAMGREYTWEQAP